jgi:hypothetical protein
LVIGTLPIGPATGLPTWHAERAVSTRYGTTGSHTALGSWFERKMDWVAFR